MIGNGALKTVDYLTEVAFGNIPGERIVRLQMRNHNIPANTEVTLWDQGGLHTYLTEEKQLYISSSNAADVAVDIGATGLDDTYTEVIRAGVTNGQNQVAVNGGLFKVFEAFVTGNVDPLGDIYLAEADTLTDGVPDTASKIKSKILFPNNNTFNGFWTVPAGETVKSINIFYSSGKNHDVDFISRFKLLGGVWRRNFAFPLYQNANQSKLDGLIIPEKTDIDFLVTSTFEGAQANAVPVILLAKN